MRRFALLKVARAVLVVLAVTVLTQWILELAPGSPADVILGDTATPEAVAELNRELGFDRPFVERYTTWLGDAISGDLGTSPVTRNAVLERVGETLPITLQLIVMSTTLALLLAVAASVITAMRPDGWLDRALSVLSSASLATPVFVAGPILMFFLAVQQGMFPIAGWTHLTDDLGENLRAATLPSLAIAITEFGVFYRLLRADLGAVLQEDFIDAARARGVRPWRLVLVHALRPASVSTVTVAGISVGRLLGGTVVVESLFTLPGLGLLMTSSIGSRDLVTIQGVVIIVAIAYVAINTLIDIVYGVLDPRVRLAR